MQFPQSQTFIAKKIVGSLSNSIVGEISIGKVYIVFFNKIIINDVSIVSNDNSPIVDSLKKNFNQSDTLLSCRKVSVSLSILELLKTNIKLSAINLEDGVFNLQNEGNGVTNLSRIFSSKNKKEKDTSSFSLDLLANSLKIKNFRFTLNNPANFKANSNNCVDFANLSLKNIYITLNKISLKNGTLNVNVKNISALDHSGFNLKSLSCNVQVSSKETMCKNLYLQDNYSIINAKYFFLRYNSSKDLSDFVKKVVLGIDFNNTFLDFKTIGSFTQSMSNSGLALYLDGKVEGPICALKSDALEVTSPSGLTYLKLKPKLIGLPDITQTMATIKILECYTTSNDIANIISSINNRPKIEFFNSLSPFIRYNLKGSLDGLLYDFVTKGKIESSVGDVNFDLLVNADPKEKGIVLDGNIKTNNLNIGKIISNKLIGNVTMETSVIANLKDAANGGNDIRIKSLKIHQLNFNNYNYSNIIAIGQYTDKFFDGKVICHDPNLNFIFQGLLSFNKKSNSKYNFYLDLPFANLAELNIDKRDKKSEIGFTTAANFIQTKTGDINGTIDIFNPYYKNSAGEFDLGNIKLHSTQTGNNFKASINASLLKGEYSGNITFITFIKTFLQGTVYSTASNYLGKENNNTEDIPTSISSKLYLQTFDTKGLCEVLMPGLFIAPNTKLEMSIFNNNNYLNLNSKAISLSNNLLKDININISKQDSLLQSNFYVNSINLGNFKLDSTYLKVNGFDNNLNVNLKFTGDSSVNMANIHAKVNLEKELGKSKIDILLDSSNIKLKGEKWILSPAYISIVDSVIAISNLKFYNGEQSLSIGGSIDKTSNDSLVVKLNNFNVGVFNQFLTKDFNFEGYFSGNANISHKDKLLNLYLDLLGNNVNVNKHSVGLMKIKSKWDNKNKRINMLLSTQLDNRTTSTIVGSFFPDSSYLAVNAALDRLELGYFEPFLEGIVSNISGTISGDISLSGRTDKLKLESENCRVKDMNFKVDFTSVPYILNGGVKLNEHGISADNLIITDHHNGKATVKGGLSYEYFKDIKLSTHLTFNNLLCLSTSEKENEAFYGNAYASGTMDITGPLNKLLLDINAISNNNTSIHIPLSNSATASQTNILTFVQPRKDSVAFNMDSLIKATKPIKIPTELAVKLRMEVNPNANILIEINKAVGDIIKANGNGVITMDINPSKEIFNIFGDYNINQGSYKFVVLGLASRDFTIQPGGTINFNGDIQKTNLNISALYKTKASINTLIADTSSVSSRRLVECVLNMNGQLMNPELSFNILIPDLDPTIKARVESALSTDDQIQKQFMALLVSGGFLPDAQSGIANNSTILYSNASEILSNQLNNIFQQLGIPIDLGLNYQRGEKGMDVFDVALSTPLFNNRVLVSGNIGNDPYSKNTNREVIGNFDVEVKLDKNGKLRLTIFSHAADQYSNYLDNTQRNGIGMIYQQSFNNFKELFRKKTPQEKQAIKEEKKNKKTKRKTNKNTIKQDQ